MKLLTRHASEKIGTPDGRAEWDRLLKENAGNYAAIRPRLTDGWRLIGDTDFHDTKIHGIERPRKSELVLQVDMRPRWKQPPLRVCTLRFFGVSDLHLPYSVKGDTWLYTEVSLSQTGDGELRALLQQNWIRIVARDVDFLTNFVWDEEIDGVRPKCKDAD